MRQHSANYGNRPLAELLCRKTAGSLSIFQTPARSCANLLAPRLRHSSIYTGFQCVKDGGGVLAAQVCAHSEGWGERRHPLACERNPCA